MLEKLLYSMRSVTLNQWRDLRMRSASDDEQQQQHGQASSACVEGDSIEFLEDHSTRNCRNQVLSEQKMCQWS